MLPPEGGPSQIGALATSQETWPEVARDGRKPVRQNRGGTPTGERIPQDARPCQLHGRLEQASVGVPLPFLSSVGSLLLLLVIAGFDPAIHADTKRGQTFGRSRKPQLTMDHRVKPGGDEGRVCAHQPSAVRRGEGKSLLDMTTTKATKQTIEGVPVEHYKLRFKEERAKLRRYYCTVFKFWRTCSFKACKKKRACLGDAGACLKRSEGGVARSVQWDARQKLLAATPPSIGSPERAARECMPCDLYRK
jgi:hypothetical protein